MLLLDRIEGWAIETPEKVALSFLDDQGDIEESVTYKELALITSSMADDLLSRSELKPGDRVLLIYPPSLDFIISFIACLKARLIAVPVIPPDPRRRDKALVMFHSVATSCDARCALTSGAYNYTAKLASLKSLALNPEVTWPDLSWIVTDSLISNGKKLSASSATSCRSLNHSSADLSPTYHSPITPAFLQFTSGSSSDPKGVIVTEDSLDHNLSLIARALQTNTSTVCASWLPQYHHMGLVTSYLGVLWCGGMGRYCSPESFHRNHLLWITILSRYRATHTQAPDFAFALTAQMFLAMSSSQRKAFENDLDLSSLRHFALAEPIRCASVEMFEAVFQKYGLSSEIIFPSYALAEHTALVCSNGRTQLRLDRKELQKNRVKQVTQVAESVVLMSCGNPIEFGSSVDVKVVRSDEPGNEDDEECDADVGVAVILPENEIGEIWINSSSKAHGYWNGTSIITAQRQEFMLPLPLESDGAVSSVPTTDTEQQPLYLRTGDLGFLSDGQLYLCGRLRDAIVSRVYNIYPQDIELSCEQACPELRNGRSSAFGINTPPLSEESVVFIAELSEETSLDPTPTLSTLADKIFGIVLQEQGVSLATVLFLPAGAMPKTISGKAAQRRLWVKKAFLSAKLSPLFRSDTLELTPMAPMAPDSPPQREEGGDPLDPRGMSEESLLRILTAAVKEIIPRHSSDEIQSHADPDLSPDCTLSSLGVDSPARRASLQKILNREFSSQLSSELLSNPSLTLRCIARAFSSDSQHTPRPFLIEAWKLLDFLRAQEKSTGTVPVGRVSQEWLAEHKIQANLLSLPSPCSSSQSSPCFLDGCALTEAPLSSQQDRVYIAFALFACGVFFWLPALAALIFWTLPLPIALATILLFYSIVFTLPADSWPPAYRLSFLMKSAVHYLSVRVIVDSPIDVSTPSIYAMEPHGWLPIPQSIHQLLNEWITGENFHLLAANTVFYMPIFNIIAKLQGCRPVDKKTFMKTLLSGRSVGVIPGGIAEMFEYLGPSSDTEVLKLCNRKGFVNLALKTGSQIVPCYTFGCWDTFHIFTSKSLQRYSRLTGIPLLLFWGRYFLPIPLRTPILIAIGRPIRCPQVDNPSPELINEFHSRYLRETKSLFDKYKNAYGWGDRTLCLKK